MERTLTELLRVLDVAVFTDDTPVECTYFLGAQSDDNTLLTTIPDTVDHMREGRAIA
jgi:hypothetical protein